MTAAVAFHRLAAAEFVAARRRYARYGATTEARFVAEVESAVGRVAANPAAGSPSYGACRWVRVRRYPYLLHYEETGAATVRVYAVAHGGRRPGYWLRRRTRP